MTDFTPPRRLTAEDDADGFDCGLPVVNDWLRNQLRNAGKQHTAVAYATFCDGAPAGFYTLGAYSIGHAEANGWLRRNSPDRSSGTWNPSATDTSIRRAWPRRTRGAHACTMMSWEY